MEICVFSIFMPPSILRDKNKSDFSSINIGKRLIKLINQINNYNNEIIFKKLPENDPKRRKPDISLAKKILNWQPKISLRDGLIKTIDYYNNLNKD